MMQFIVFAILIMLGYVAGRKFERDHFASIQQREQALVNLPTTSSKYPIGEVTDITKSYMVTGSVVISVDYFKRILATLRNLFGGNIRAYETLVDRARREAILRLKESCLGAEQIINLRIETSSISQGGQNQIGSVEVLAYGTAIYTNKS